MVIDPERAQSQAWPVPAVGMIAAGVYLFIAVRMLSLTGGQLVYPLDDTYIHMAIAKNVALHGVWGVSAEHFTATSSSPLWTALLSLAFKVSGVHDATPLVLNTVLALLCVLYMGRVLTQNGITGVALFAMLTLCVLLMPIAPIAWLGMEHTLHILLTLLTASEVARLVRRPSSTRLIGLCVLTAAMVLARYEGLFVAAGCSLALVLTRRIGAAVALTVAGTAPIIGVGLWNMSHGWFFLPASVLLKQAVMQPAGSTLVSALADNLAAAPAAFFVLVVAGAGLLIHQTAVTGLRTVHPLLLVFLTAALLHFVLARFGAVYRYESYLMALGSIAVGVSMLERDSGALAWVKSGSETLLVVVSLLCLALSSRTIESNALAANMTGHIFRQQWHMAALLREHYDGEPVALNDIGTTSYYTKVRILDLVGLGSLEVATLRRAGHWDRGTIDALLSRQGVDVAVIYDTWFPGDQAFYKEWVRVADWVTDDQAVRGQGTVSFFARDAAAAARLRQALVAFDAAHPQPATTRTLF